MIQMEAARVEVIVVEAAAREEGTGEGQDIEDFHETSAAGGEVVNESNPAKIIEDMATGNRNKSACEGMKSTKKDWLGPYCG